MMKRDQCLKILARGIGADDIVVPVYQAAFEWMLIRPSDLNYVTTGAMGQASSHALGLALAFPGRRVLVIDGDGSLLMNLGALITCAEQSPPNLYHFLGNNGVYEANGSHPLPGAGKTDFCALALAAGFPAAHRFADLGEFEAGLAAVLQAPGPVFVDLHVEQGESYPQDYTLLHSAERRARFKRAVNLTAAARP